MKDLKLEAQRCLKCKNAKCKANCPIATPIPEVIALFQEGKIMEAGEMLFENNPLSVVCAIVCPHEDQCKGNCIRGIKGEPIEFHSMEEEISKAFLSRVTTEKSLHIAPAKNQSVAIIGGGPAGIAIALILAKRGYQVTIFDAHEKIGGVLRYGIPDYRLPNELVDQYEELLLAYGVSIRPNTLIGPVLTIDRLLEDGYDAIFIGTGVWNPKTLNIKGETLGNVHYAIDYLKSPQVYRLGQRVCVIGAGNVAMDAARVAKRNGASEVCVLYRKGYENMTCTKAELQEAIDDEVSFELFKAPVELRRDGVKYNCTKNEVDENGKVQTVFLEGEEGFYPCDSIIIAVSQNPKNNIVSTTTGLETSKWGLLLTDDFGHTTREGVFATGDVVTGAKTVVHAVAHAKVVADEMEKYLNQLVK